MTFLGAPVYHSVLGFEDHLDFELGGVYEKYGDLFFAASTPEHPVFWQNNIWKAPFTANFDSISEAASILKNMGRNWSPVFFRNFRRGALITEKLPSISKSMQTKIFPCDLPQESMGSWTLLDEHKLAASADCTSLFPSGVIEFEQDKEGPPSRAYLKLQEALVRAGKFPLKGERCFDAGASPGGWSWTLSKLGADVISCDRAPLEKKIADLPNITYIKHDAFTLNPQDIGAIDWLFCDAACYPKRLFDWIMKWLASGLCKNYIATIKMQGAADAVDFEVPRCLAAVDSSFVVHLYHNKHELTWIKTS
jgi:23S rRNA (cytidine2498-2'-O)-methyltransferase